MRFYAAYSAFGSISPRRFVRPHRFIRPLRHFQVKLNADLQVKPKADCLVTLLGNVIS